MVAVLELGSAMIQWALITAVRAAWGELAGWGCCRSAGSRCTSEAAFELQLMVRKLHDNQQGMGLVRVKFSMKAPAVLEGASS